MSSEADRVRSLGSDIADLQGRLARSKTTGKAGGVQVRISGRGAVEIVIDDSYGLDPGSPLLTDLVTAAEQALDKHRRRSKREAEKLLST